jgi:dTDP-4-dehydrorhamnose reductase
MTDLSNPPSERLLVTGASGFLGWHLCRQAIHRWQVHGTHYAHPFQLTGATAHGIDLTHREAVKHWLSQLRPDAVIHIAALSKPNQCEQEPELSYRVNVEVTRTLAEYCGRVQIPLVFTSTEQVFDGESAPYSETARPSPINVYGRHKVAAEQLIRQLHPGAVICRMPLMYGPASPTSQSFVQGFIQKLKDYQSLSLFVDEHRSPAYVEDAAEGLLMALEKGSGVLHLGGPERISRYEFGLLLAEIFDLDASSISPSYRADVPMPAVRPADLTTHNSRAMALGYVPKTPREGLLAMKLAMQG